MKRLGYLIMTGLLLFSLTACGAQEAAKSGEAGTVNTAMEQFGKLENGVLEVTSEVKAEDGTVPQDAQMAKETLTFVNKDGKTDALFHSELTQAGTVTVTEMKMVGGKVYSRAEGAEWALQKGQKANGTFAPFGNPLQDGVATVKTSAVDDGTAYAFTMSPETLKEITKQMNSASVMLESVGTYTVNSDGLLTGLTVSNRIQREDGSVVKNVTDTRLIRFNQPEITVE